jgi:hypothetical protein
VFVAISAGCLGEIEKMGAPPGGPFKTYKWVNEGRRRRKLRAYRIPLVKAAARTEQADEAIADVA